MDCSSIPGAREGTFDLALCIYILCHLGSKEEVKRAVAETYRMLKPGGKLMIVETHVLQYMLWNDASVLPLLHKWGAPKEDGTMWSYFDEGKPREMHIRINSGRVIKVTGRMSTLSTWVPVILLEAGFQITHFVEPHLDAKAIPCNAPDYMKFAAQTSKDVLGVHQTTYNATCDIR